GPCPPAPFPSSPSSPLGALHQSFGARVELIARSSQRLCLPVVSPATSLEDLLHHLGKLAFDVLSSEPRDPLPKNVIRCFALFVLLNCQSLLEPLDTGVLPHGCNQRRCIQSTTRFEQLRRG